jgi:hypothetical protein
MDKIEEHYKVFQWLFFDREHRHFMRTDHNYYLITKKIDQIVEDYCIPRTELLSDLFVRYVESGGAEKFDQEKGNLFTWIKQWSNLELNNYKKKLYTKERQIISKMVRESDFDQLNEDLGEDFEPALFVNPVTPEDLVSNAQQKILVEKQLTETELGFLNGDLSPQEAVKLSGLSLNTFKTQLNAKLTKVRKLLND